MGHRINLKKGKMPGGNMLKTELISLYLESPDGPLNREIVAKEAIDRIKSMNHKEVIKFEEYKHRSFFNKIKNTLFSFESFISGCCFILVLMTTLFNRDKFLALNLIEWLIAMFSILGMLIFCGFFMFFKFETNGLSQDYFFKQAEEFKNEMIKLFSALSDKNFEIRAEYLEDYKKLKVIVEDNEYIKGTSSVIKKSGKSLTSYINLEEDQRAIILSIIAIVKEAEAKFN